MTHPQTRPKSAVVTHADDFENNDSFEERFEEDKILMIHLNYYDCHDHNNGFDDEHGSGSVPVV